MSTGLIEDAATRIRSSPAAGWGVAAVRTVTADSSPYWSSWVALTVLPHLGWLRRFGLAAA